MASLYGKSTTYDNSSLGNLRVSIEDLVGKYPKKKFPILNRLNGKIFNRPVDNPKYEWKEESVRPTKDILNGAIDAVVTTITATTAGVFNIDDIVLIGSEYFVVTAVASGVTLTVVRGWNSTAAVHADLAPMIRVGIAAPEGADANGAVNQGLADLYNYTQIFEDVVELSGTEEESFLYRTSDGDDNASNQITLKQQELMEMLQMAILLGVRNSDSATKRRTLGGLKYLADTYAGSANKVSMGGATAWTTETAITLSGSKITVAQEKLDTLIENLVYERANPTAIYAGYKAMRRITNWDASKTFIDRDDKQRGNALPTTYLSQAGELDLIQIPGDVLSDNIFVVDESRIGYKAFRNRGWFTEKLAKNGDSSKWQVLGEYTVKVSTPKAAIGYLYGLGL